MRKNEFSRIIEKEANTLKYISKTIDFEQVKKVCHLLNNCSGKVIVSGCGTSGAAARKISHTLNVTNVSSVFLSPADAPHGGAGLVKKNDVVILISKGGETEEINKLVDLVKLREAKIIGITEKKESYLGKNSDLILQIKVDQESDDFNMIATSSTLSVISVFDAITILISRDKQFTKEQFLSIHPGGEVGDKLRDEMNGL